MTRQAALFIATAHLLDLATLLAVANVAGIAGEANPLMRAAWSSVGPSGVIAVKSAGVGLAILLVGSSQLRLAVAVTAGLAGAFVNALAFWLIGGRL